MDTEQRHPDTDIEANRNSAASVEGVISEVYSTHAPEDVELSRCRTSAHAETLTINSSFDKFRQRKHDPLPLLPSSSFGFRYFWHRLYTVYHRIFSIILIANLVALTIVISKGPTATTLLHGAVANFMICGVSRLPWFSAIAYRLTCSIPQSAHLALRRVAAKVSHYGGIHSGSGISAISWFITFVGYATRDVARARSANTSETVTVLSLSYVVLLLLVTLVVLAYPLFRFLKHDVFEFSHRFIAWIVLVLVWVAVLLAAKALARSPGRSWSGVLVKDFTFWGLIILTSSIVAPWTTLRRVLVQPEVLSTHAIRLHFDYTKTKMSQGISISRHPLRDWHSFAAIPDSDGFSLVVSKAGDWTSSVITDCPTRLWKRAVPTYGFGRTIPLFKRVLLLATGSGIGPCLSLLSEGETPPIHVIWQTRNPLRTYGQRVVDEVRQLDRHALIIDIDKYGRQDMLTLAWSMYREVDAEAVMIVSNPKVTYDVVYGFEARGVAAYGAVFDS